jgi:PKD repeat protein
MKHGQNWFSGAGMRRSRCCLTALAALIVLAAWASTASAQAVRLTNGQFVGVYLHPGLSTAAYARQTGARPITSATRATNTAVDPNGLLYNGGPVLHTTAPYLVYWAPSGTTIAASSRNVLTRYMTDIGQDSANPSDVYAYRVLPQYTDGSGAAGQGQAFSSGSQVIDDSHVYPAVDPTTCTPAEQHGFTACITDAQIQAELSRLITVDGLPSGMGADAPIYFVVTPANVNVCMNGGGGCASDTFCAYHSAYALSGSTQVVYASIPFTLGAGCQGAGLGTTQEPNGDVADVIADNLSHENAEAVTDPLGDAWFTSNGWEVADQCELAGPNDPNPVSNNPGPTSMDAYMPTLGGNEQNGTLYDQLINGDHYFTQTLWSNIADGCEATSIVSASFTSPASVLPGVSASFDPSASSSGNGYRSTSWNWGDGSPNTVLAGAPTATTHTFAAGGTYTVTLTLVDAGGNTAQVSHTVVVDSAPTAAFSASNSVAETGAALAFNGASSSDPNPGASITGYSWSFGDGSPAASSAAPSHVFASPGSYTVTLTVAGSEGLTGTVSHALTVVAAPVAVPTISTAHPLAGSPVSFTGASSTGGISAYAWKFGDGATGSGAKPKHTYSKPGTYTVTLTVTDAAGFTSTRTLKVVVKPQPITGATVKHVNGNYFLVVSVRQAGTVRVGSGKVTLKRAGKATFKLTLSAAQRRKLGAHKTVSDKLKVSFAPAHGARTSRTFTVKLKP